jgi:plastocyanin
MAQAISLLVVLIEILCLNGSAGLATTEQGSPIAAAGFASGAWGNVIGKISVSGGYELPKPLPVFKNRSICGAAVPNETLLVNVGGGLRNAVVLLHPIKRKVSTQPVELILDNKDCAFAPHVQVATVGSRLLMKNSDPILHTVHARLGGETLFNVGLPKWRQVTKRLEQAGVISINCDVLHTWMSASIVVTDTPYFTVSDEHGKFQIDRLPLGVYEMEVWHERLKPRRQQLRLTGNVVANIELVYSVKKSR